MRKEVGSVRAGPVAARLANLLSQKISGLGESVQHNDGDHLKKAVRSQEWSEDNVIATSEAEEIGWGKAKVQHVQRCSAFSIDLAAVVQEELNYG